MAQVVAGERRPTLELYVAGAGPAYTDRVGSTGAAYLLRTGDAAILLDLGQGSFPRVASQVEPADLLGIVISHPHPDHFIDLVPLRHYLRYQCVPPRRVTVHGPASLGSRLDALHAEPGFAEAALDVVPLSAGFRRIGPFAHRFRQVQAEDLKSTPDLRAERWVLRLL